MGKSGSSSQANQETKTVYTDKRLVNESGIVATEGASIGANFHTTTNTLDGGAIKAAFDFATNTDATNGEGFNQLLNLADKIVVGAGESFNKSQDTVMGAIQTLQTDSKGAVDQKTMIILGVSAAAAIAFMARNK